jgi:hypothetical protein
MKKKTTMVLDDEFILYCQLNNITNVEKLATETFKRGFSALKYPETPVSSSKEKIIEKEVIKEIPVEVIKEVVIEKIVEKEIIKEVPVEKIIEVIKEVPVQVKGETQIITKEVIKEIKVEVPVIKEVTNTEENNKLKEENKKLKSELDKIKQSLDKLNRAKYMKNSDLGSLYSE